MIAGGASGADTMVTGWEEWRSFLDYLRNKTPIKTSVLSALSQIGPVFSFSTLPVVASSSAYCPCRALSLCLLGGADYAVALSQQLTRLLQLLWLHATVTEEPRSLGLTKKRTVAEPRPIVVMGRYPKPQDLNKRWK